MDPRFPRGISAGRIASFVTTAAWIQGTAAEDVVLPPEALDNFLRRHGVRVKKARQAPAPPAEEESEEEEEEDEEEEEEEEGEEEEDEEDGDESSASSGDSDSEPGVSSATGSSGASSGEEDEDEESVGPGGDLPEGVIPGSQAAITGDGSGPPSIDSSPKLSPGALAAIIVWSIIGFVAILVLAFFFSRRRRRARQMQEDAEEGKPGEPMAMQGAAPAVIEPIHLRPGSQGSARSLVEPIYPRPPSQETVQPMMDPVYIRPESQTLPVMMEPTQEPKPDPQIRPGSVAPSGQWMAVPPWQEEPPTWRDPHPWRTSTQPSVVPVGLPANPSPRATKQAGTLMARQSEIDRRTKYTAVTESTIFAYR